MTGFFVPLATAFLWLTAGINEVFSASTINPVNSSMGHHHPQKINGSAISREHVTLFFDHRVRYHTHEADNAYSKADLAAMVNVVSKRFTKLLTDSAPKLHSLPPNDTAPSRVWIPSVVAQHNKDRPASTPPMEVVVSFEFDIDIYTQHRRRRQVEPYGGEEHYDDAYINHYPYPEHIHWEQTSFDVAKHMADAANEIYPETVKTLMMTMYRTETYEYADESTDYSYWQYIQDWHQSDDEFELIYVEHLYHSAWPYNLGIFMDVHDCGRFGGHLPHKVKEVLKYVEQVALFIDPTTFHHLTTLSAQETHKMFLAKFEDCERKLQKEKASVKVMPSSLWKNHHVTISSMVDDWIKKSQWAVENSKEVIMYEAFDTPGGRDFYYWGHGWWRLKDRTTYTINETVFVEKIDDANSAIYTKDLYASPEESSSSEEEIPKVPSSSRDSASAAQSVSQVTPAVQYAVPAQQPPTIIHTTATSTNHAVYIVLVFLSAICAILVIAQVYFHAKIFNGSAVAVANNGTWKRFDSSGKGEYRHHFFTNPGLPSLEEQTGVENPNFSQNKAEDPQSSKTCSEDDGVASINGSVMEMSDDTMPIVSVSYKKI